jgi:hypothetical protein
MPATVSHRLLIAVGAILIALTGCTTRQAAGEPVTTTTVPNESEGNVTTVVFEPFAEEPTAEIRGLERDDVYLEADFVEAVGFVGAYHVFRYGGTIVDTLSPSRGEPGECLQVNFGGSGFGDCRAVSSDDAGDPWLVFRTFQGAPVVVWSGLDSAIVRVTVSHEDGTVSVQAPLSGAVVIPVTPGETLDAVAETADGQSMSLPTD